MRRPLLSGTSDSGGELRSALASRAKGRCPQALGDDATYRSAAWKAIATQTAVESHDLADARRVTPRDIALAGDGARRRRTGQDAARLLRALRLGRARQQRGCGCTARPKPVKLLPVSWWWSEQLHLAELAVNEEFLVKVCPSRGGASAAHVTRAEAAAAWRNSPADTVFWSHWKAVDGIGATDPILALLRELGLAPLEFPVGSWAGQLVQMLLPLAPSGFDRDFRKSHVPVGEPPMLFFHTDTLELSRLFTLPSAEREVGMVYPMSYRGNLAAVVFPNLLVTLAGPYFAQVLAYEAGAQGLSDRAPDGDELLREVVERLGGVADVVALLAQVLDRHVTAAGKAHSALMAFLEETEALGNRAIRSRGLVKDMTLRHRWLLEQSASLRSSLDWEKPEASLTAPGKATAATTALQLRRESMLDRVQNLREAIRSAIELRNARLMREVIDVAVAEQRRGARLQRAVTAVTALLLAPALVATTFGALPAVLDHHVMLRAGLIAGAMVLAAAVSYFVLRRALPDLEQSNEHAPPAERGEGSSRSSRGFAPSTGKVVQRSRSRNAAEVLPGPLDQRPTNEPRVASVRWYGWMARWCVDEFVAGWRASSVSSADREEGRRGRAASVDVAEIQGDRRNG